MKIAIYNPGLHVIGGGEKYVGTMAQILSEQHSVDLFLTHPVDLGILERRLDLNLEHVGTIELFKNRMTRPRNVADWLRNRRLTKRLQSELLQLTRDYDLTIQLESDSPFRLAARRNILHIQVPHRRWRMNDFFGAIRQKQFEDVRREFFRRMAFRSSLRHFDLLIFNSEFTSRISKSNWRPQVPSVVIQPPIDVPVEAFRWEEKRDYILSVGRFFARGHEKRQDVLIRAFKAYSIRMGRNWELHLAGGADNSRECVEIIEHLRNMASDLPVIFHLNVDRLELLRLYSASKFYWHAAGFEVDECQEPDRVEHFGMAVVEAMTNGCIPLGVNRGGLREIIGHRFNGFLWESLDDLVEMTEELSSDVAAPVISARAHVRSLDFSRQKFCEKILGVISDPC